MDFAQLLDAHFGVDGGGFELFVAEELLDEADVRSAVQEVAGAAVAEEVAASGAADSGQFYIFADAAAEDVGVERAAVAAEEKGGVGGAGFETRADFHKVAFEPVQGAAADGHDAVFAAFGVAQVQGVAFAVEVCEVERDDSPRRMPVE